MAWGCTTWCLHIALAFLHHFTDFMEQKRYPQLTITVYYYTAQYPVTWLSSVELLWVDPSQKMGKS